VIVNEENAHDTKDFIEKRLAAAKSQRSTGETEELALIIGTSLSWFDGIRSLI
jgi:phospholipid-transporting ATPase